MGKPVKDETLKVVWEAFLELAHKDPGTTPNRFTVDEHDELERIIVTREVLQIGLTEGVVECRIPEFLQQSEEHWSEGVVPFVERFVEAFGISHGKGTLIEYLRGEGFVGYGEGITLTFNPLTAAVGESDEF